MEASQPEAQAFIEQIQHKREWTQKEFLLFCKKAILLARKYPVDKDKLAYWIVSMGAYTDPNNNEIRNLAADLELPDYHVYTGDGLSVQQKWDKMEQYVDEALAKPIKEDDNAPTAKAAADGIFHGCILTTDGINASYLREPGKNGRVVVDESLDKPYGD